jgi:imidazolonepropionase-like amidohydrolase
MKHLKTNNITIMKYLLYLTTLLLCIHVQAQENVYAAPAQKQPIVLSGGTIHVGNGQVIENGYLLFENGKIIYAGPAMPSANNAQTINVSGKHIYPGIIAASTNLGLLEVSSTKSTADFSELGDMNPSVKSLVAYNAESKIINTLRTNGVLLAHIVPQGGTISGTSSVVQLDAWNWEDAAYKTNNGIHLNMPALVNRPNPFAAFFGGAQTPPGDALKNALVRVEEIRNFFREAKAYHAAAVKETVNLKYEAVKGLFNKTQKLFVHCDLVKEMMVAIDMKKEFGLDVVIVGGSDSWMMADILKENNVPVILSEPHSLPSTADDDVDLPYKTGYLLQKAGVLFTICQDGGDGFWQQRCLPFQAGTMAAYGLTREEALAAITLNPAKILGVDNQTGSLEKGKDANIVVSDGDLLDMMTNKVTHAFIQGRQVSLDNKHTQLFEKYKYKYGMK